MPQLELQYFATQIFWLAVVFASIYVFVSKYFIPRVSAIVVGRQNKIDENLTIAQGLIEEQKALSASLQEMLTKARNTAFEIKTSAFKEAELKFNKLIAKAEKEISSKNVKQDERLARYKFQLQEDIEYGIEDLSKQIIAVILSDSQKKHNFN